MQNRLPELRALRGWSQGDLAEALQISRQTINTPRCDTELPLAFGRRFEDGFRP